METFDVHAVCDIRHNTTYKSKYPTLTDKNSYDGSVDIHNFYQQM